jgi:GTP-binding protein
MSSPYQKTSFLLSAANVKQLPPDVGIEIAIVGRSNAGKSSVLNRITHQKGLARVSKTPGRTQLLNVFVVDDDRRLVDLPGYGYAKVPLAAKQKWQQTVDIYVRTRKSLRGLLVVMDIRHPLTALDKVLLDYCSYHNVPVHVLLNKADKLSKGASAKTLKTVQSVLTDFDNSVTFQLFSAKCGTGLKELLSVLDHWYDYHNNKDSKDVHDTAKRKPK